MAAPVKPARKLSLKKDAYWLVPAIADIDNPTVDEINGVSGFYPTCFLLQDQAGPQKTVNKTQLAASLCDDTQPEALLPASIEGQDLVVVFDPQAAANHPDKAAFEFLRDGFTGFMVRRQNVLNDVSDLVVGGEFVDVFPVQIEAAWPDKNETGPAGFYVARCGVAVTNSPAINVQVVGAS